MGKKHFDKNIKDKLEGLHIDYDAASWDSFEEKLDKATVQQDIDDLDFDQQIRENLNGNLGFEFQEEHWQELSTRIDHDNELANKIYLFKIIELVILVLLAYSFFQIEPIKHPTKKLPLYAHSEIFNAIDKDQILEKAIGKNSVAQDNFSVSDALSAFVIERPKEHALYPVDRKLASFELHDKQLLGFTLLPKTSLQQSELSSNKSEELGKSYVRINEDEEARELLAINTLIGNSEEKYIAPPAFIQSGNEKWLSFSNSADINLVNTPTKFLINGGDNLLESTGASGAITYNVKSRKNEFEIGLGYSYKNYDPDLKEEFFVNNDGIAESSRYRRSLNRIAFHVAQVPINYRRYVIDNYKWSMFMTFGITHNFILYSDYELTDKLISGIRGSKNIGQISSNLLRRTYYTGLLQNIETENVITKRSNAPSPNEFRTEGNIFDNAFITSYTGLGVQRYLCFNRSIFMQAGYHHQFFGDKLGPNNDQINTFSVTVGGKFKI